MLILRPGHKLTAMYDWDMNCDMEPVENYLQTGYSATLGIWNADMDAYDERTEQKTNEELLQMVETEREINDASEEMDRSHLETWFITENKVRRTNPKEEGLWETKNSVLGLVTEDGGSYCWIWRSKDVGTRQIKLASMKMETCHTGRILQREIHTLYL